MADTSRTAAAGDGQAATPPVRISAATCVALVGTVIAYLVLRNAFVAAHRVLGWAVACTAAAFLVEPVVNLLGRVIPRLMAVVVTFAIGGAVVVGLVFGTIDDLDREVGRLQRAAPAATERLEARDDELGSAMRDLQLSERVSEFLDALDERVGSGGGALAQSAPTAPIWFVNGILTVFLLAYGPAIVNGAAGRISEREQRVVAVMTMNDAIHRARLTVGALLLQGIAAGVLTWGFATLVDLPAPIVLGLVAGIAAMLPDVGILLGALPTAALTAGFETARLGGVVLLVALALQVAEAVVLRPRVDRHGVAIGPAVVWIVAVIAYTVYGVGAAVVALVYAIVIVGILDQVPAARRALDISRTFRRS